MSIFTFLIPLHIFLCAAWSSKNSGLLPILHSVLFTFSFWLCGVWVYIFDVLGCTLRVWGVHSVPQLLPFIFFNCHSISCYSIVFVVSVVHVLIPYYPFHSLPWCLLLPSSSYSFVHGLSFLLSIHTFPSQCLLYTSSPKVLYSSYFLLFLFLSSLCLCPAWWCP